MLPSEVIHSSSVNLSDPSLSIQNKVSLHPWRWVSVDLLRWVVWPCYAELVWIHDGELVWIRDSELVWPCYIELVLSHYGELVWTCDTEFIWPRYGELVWTRGGKLLCRFAGATLYTSWMRSSAQPLIRNHCDVFRGSGEVIPYVVEGWTARSLADEEQRDKIMWRRDGLGNDQREGECTEENLSLPWFWWSKIWFSVQLDIFYSQT